MKKLQYLIAALPVIACLSSLVSCTDSKKASLADDEFLITGQLNGNKGDSALLFLVPMEGPHPRPVDSVYVGADGAFEFRGNVEQMAVLRLAWRQRMGTQELLVVTEPGVTYVTLDSISSAHGTPQNDALQQWKEFREASSRELSRIGSMRRQPGYDKAEAEALTDSLRQAINDYNYDFLKGLGRQTLSVFLMKMVGGGLDSIRRAELNELLVDTVDYTQPQPGFRR